MITVLIGVLTLGLGLIFGKWIWSPTTSYLDLQKANGELKDDCAALRGTILGLHDQINDLAEELAPYREEAVKAVSEHGGMHVVDVETFTLTPVVDKEGSTPVITHTGALTPAQIVTQADETRIIAMYGYGSDMHQAWMSRNGDPGDERIPLGIENHVTGTIEELAAGLVDHGVDGGRLSYDLDTGEIITGPDGKPLQNMDECLSIKDLDAVMREVNKIK